MGMLERFIIHSDEILFLWALLTSGMLLGSFITYLVLNYSYNNPTHIESKD